MAEGAAAGDGPGGRVVKGLGRGVEHRYRKLYEEDLNPFTAFLQQEAAAQTSQLHFVDRTVYRFVRATLGSRTSRTAFFYGLVVVASLLGWAFVGRWWLCGDR